jgi:hypothetical protein
MPKFAPISMNKAAPSQIAVSRSAKLNIAAIWPLNIRGTYLQKVTATAWGKKETFSVYLTLEDDMIEAIAFSDVAGRLYKLKVTPGNILWESSACIPTSIQPENILTDFLLINLNAGQLASILKGARVFERGNLSVKTRTIKERKILRTISYSQPTESLWGQVIIENPIYGYKLNIQTVEQ